MSSAFLLGPIRPDGKARQGLLLLLGWAQGCIGGHLRLRPKPLCGSWRIPLARAAVRLPRLALFGTVSAGRELDRLLEADPTAGGRLVALAARPRAPSRAFC
ncbi:MAG: hypothetical protein RMK81_01950 [Geminicoccaceae bacterium]|nr:hypothetical protein [Geminicoccaceae bacterium]